MLQIKRTVFCILLQKVGRVLTEVVNNKEDEIIFVRKVINILHRFVHRGQRLAV